MSCLWKRMARCTRVQPTSKADGRFSSRTSSAVSCRAMSPPDDLQASTAAKSPSTTPEGRGTMHSSFQTAREPFWNKPPQLTAHLQLLCYRPNRRRSTAQQETCQVLIILSRRLQNIYTYLISQIISINPYQLENVRDQKPAQNLTRDETLAVTYSQALHLTRESNFFTVQRLV